MSAVEHTRREVLGGAAALAVAGGALPGVAREALAAASPNAAAKQTFWDVSKRLTGLSAPDPGLGDQVYSVLSEIYDDLDAKLGVIKELLGSGLGDAGLRQAAAAREPSLATLTDDLIAGWYLGVVGPPDKRRCIAFENIVSHRLVEKHLQIPSYCGGAPGFWRAPPAGP